MENAKKLVIIGSFCNTPEKLNILQKNIDIIKSIGLNILLISPISLSSSITSKCDYFFYTKDNPVLTWPDSAITFWRHIYTQNGKQIALTNVCPDFGWAGLYQVKQSSQIALSLDYNQFYHIIYDLTIDENVLRGLSSTETNLIYPSKRGSTVWQAGLHFMIFNRENLANFISAITIEDYLNMSGRDAFKWLLQCQEKLAYDIADTPVEDLIYYYDHVDIFDMSPPELTNCKLFIEKDEQIPNYTVKLLFFEVHQEEDITIWIDDKPHPFRIKPNSIFDLGFDAFATNQVFIENSTGKIEITNIIKNVKLSTLRIEE